MSRLDFKPYIPAQPPATHPPPEEPCKVIQPTDPFHNAFYYTNEEQNNVLGKKYQPEVITPVRYVRRRKHEFIPIDAEYEAAE